VAGVIFFTSLTPLKPTNMLQSAIYMKTDS